MIGKAEWFCPRRFGWGLGIRKVEGLAYIAVQATLVGAVWYSPLDTTLKAILSTVLIGLFAIDFLDIMNKVYSKLDERERKHQLVAERNSGFIAIAGITAYLLYISFTTPSSGLPSQLYPLVGIAVAMAIAKGATLLYLERAK